jgi:glycosyltransferase involved in cell wall biosynthesis
MATPRNILFFGDFGCTTGFGNVSKQLIDHWTSMLEEDDRISILALNNFEKEAYQYNDKVVVIPANNTREERDLDPHCRNSLLRFLFNMKFTHVFLFNDVEVFNPLKHYIADIRKKQIKAHKESFKTILYFPVDSPPRKQDLDILKSIQHPYTYTEYGREQVLKLITTAKNIQVAPHGTDDKSFYPIPDKNRKLLSPTADFVFGTVNRNSARKDIATLILAFWHLKAKVKEPRIALYLHLNPLDPYGINVERLCDRLGLVYGVDVICPKDFNENQGYSTQDLNEIYNAMDCFVTTTTAEGWGLSVVEAMACKVPVVAPIHTSLKEITNEGHLVYSIREMRPNVFVQDFEKIRMQSEVEDVAAAMLKVLNEYGSDKQNRLVMEAYKKAISYKWEETAKKLFEAFR